MDLGWTGERDVAGALRFLARQPEVAPDRLGVVGLSMGGEVAVGASARDARIAAVVAEGATARSARDKGWLSEAHGWRGQVQEGIEHLQTAATDLLTSARPPVGLHDAVAESGRPTLLIAAGTVADSGHTGGLATEPEEWEARVIGFLDDHLSR